MIGTAPAGSFLPDSVLGEGNAARPFGFGTALDSFSGAFGRGFLAVEVPRLSGFS